MKAPRIFVVVGLNRRQADLIAWFFDEEDARELRDLLNDAEHDEYAYRIEQCEAAEPMPDRPRW